MNIDEIRKNPDKVNWKYISSYQKLSEDFIREFHDKVYWTEISCHQTLSEDFIKEFKNEVNWYGISWNQTLSEEFIREFQDKVSWKYCSLTYRFFKDLKNIKTNISNICQDLDNIATILLLMRG